MEIIENCPSMGWSAKLLPKSPASHKYDHGHVVILGSRRLTGAGCLAAMGALRMGAGLCTVAAPAETAMVYRTFSPSLMVEQLDELARFKMHLTDARRTVAVIGPGAGLDNPGGLKKAVFDAVQMEPRRICVLDADALTVFTEDTNEFFRIIGDHCVLTPHEGEFARLFPDLQGDRVARAQEAAHLTGAILVLKGLETVIASPKGGCVINRHASGWLASAGTGDVLAGMIAGLAARNLGGLSLFDAVCAAVWMHGEAGIRAGECLISEDLPAHLPAIWRDLQPEPSIRKDTT